MFRNIKTAMISPQPLNEFYGTKTKLYLEAFFIITIMCGKESVRNNLKF